MDSKRAVKPNFSEYIPLEPTRLFDKFYFVGTRSVGSFVIDSGDGLIMIDTGWGQKDCSQFVDDMKKLGLKPDQIKIILISHEHLDHYGGVPYLKRDVCPLVKVALSRIGWNHLQARPAAAEPGRPESIDIFLTDGQKIALGDTQVQIISTPGHAPGCVSFIIPVTDNGIRHMVGIMGGGGVSPDWERAYLYKSSIEYFMQYTRQAKCDVGLFAHTWALPWDVEADMALLRVRKPGDPNPLVIGTEKFETLYLQEFRDTYQETIKCLQPEPLHRPPPWIK